MKLALRQSKRSPSLRSTGLYLLLAIATMVGCLLIPPMLSIPSAISVAQTAPNRHADPENLVEQSRNLYETGRYSEAVPLLQQASQTYQSQGNLLRQALTLSNLSQTYQQLGQWVEAREAITQSLVILGDQETNRRNHDSENRLRVLAQTLDIQGRLQLEQGQAAEALTTWEQAASVYEQIDDPMSGLESQLYQAQALQALGLYQRTTQLLTDLLPTFEQQQPSLTQAIALRSLGEVLLVAGDLAQARQRLEQSLEMAQQLPAEVAKEAIASIYIGLGNLTHAEALTQLTSIGLTPTEALDRLNTSPALGTTTRSVLQQRNRAAAEAFYQQTESALDLYEQAIARTDDHLIQAQARLHQFNLLVETQSWELAQSLYPELQAQLQTQPLSHTNLFSQIEFAQSLITEHTNLESNPKQRSALSQAIPQLLNTIHQQAVELGDQRAQSYALGTLGEFYEKTGQWAEAKTFTQQALGLSQAVNAADISYRWQWQLGRVLKSQANTSDAIAAYESAFATLQLLRRDIVTTNLGYQFAFRESAEEPIYRELISLLLSDEKPEQDKLRRSREVATSLQVAELENFLGEPCADATPELVDSTVDRLAAKTAVLYPIVLGDRLEVVVKLPQEQDLQHFRSIVSFPELRDTIQILQLDLEQEYTFEAVRENSQRLYNWIVQPIQERLGEKQVDTLVFALDGILRNIPMSVLYDGEKYLVEAYATAITLGLDLPTPSPLRRNELEVLAVGLTDPPENLIINSQDLSANFAKLTNVNAELDAISASGISVTPIRDQQFTETSFNRTINEAPFPIVHMATHGQFSSDPESTFLLTSDGAIEVDDLSNLFRTRSEIRTDTIDLLILNACETAAGDQLAALGIAGTAFRAGARSVIASLWTLDDTSSVELAKQFYQNLAQSEITKAEALRRAQLALLSNPQYKHPRYWSTYVFVGNWL